MNWSKALIGDICEVSTGQSAPQDVDAFTDVGHPFIRAGSLGRLVQCGDEDVLEKITEDNAKRYRLRLFPKGTIVFAKSGMSATLGRVYRLKNPCYVVSHLATIIPSSIVDGDFLLRWLTANPPSRLISNEAYPSIKTSTIEKVQIPLPNLIEQQRIAAILFKAHVICNKRREACSLADMLLHAAFQNMFGDPVSNSMNWNEEPIGKLAAVTTGNTPSRNVSDYFGDFIEWIKSDNINSAGHYLTKSKEGLSETGAKIGRKVPEGSTLITCIAGSPSCIGNAALADRTVAFNQQINALTPINGIEPLFLYGCILFSKKRIQAASTNGMKGMVSKGVLEQVRLICPPKPKREAFVRIFEKIITMQKALQLSLQQSEDLVASLSYQLFPDMAKLEPTNDLL